MNLIGKNIVLRAIEKSDLEFLRAMINDPEMEKRVVGWSLPVSSEQQLKWFESQDADSKNIRLIIEYENKPVGLVAITSIDWKNRNAGHGIKLYSDEVKRKGIGTETVRLVMQYAFEELQLNRLYASIMSTNIPSQKLYEKCGWKVEGVSRQSVFKGNQYIDELQIGILKDEYEILKNQWN